MIIKSCISKLKADTTDGDIGFNSNHLIHGSQRLCVMLSILFNEMLYHGYYPSDLLKSTIVSIPKEKSSSLSNSNNYRGISLFNCINKLSDYVIIDLCGDRLVTSDMQYAYKPCHSTNLCTAMLKEIIDIYVRKTVKHSTEYIMESYLMCYYLEIFILALLE